MNISINFDPLRYDILDYHSCALHSSQKRLQLEKFFNLSQFNLKCAEETSTGFPFILIAQICSEFPNPECLGYILVDKVKEELQNCLTRHPDSDYDNTCLVKEIAVKELWQRNGIGKKLMLQAMQKAAAYGIQFMEASHPAWNEECQAIHQPDANITPEYITEILKGEKLQSFFDGMPGLAHKGCMHYLCSRRPYRAAIYDIRGFNSTIPNEIQSQHPASLLKRTGVTKAVIPSELCNESAEGFLFYIWENNTLRGALLGTSHEIRAECLDFRSAIRERIAAASIILCEYIEDGYEPPLIQYEINNGQWIGPMEASLIALARSQNHEVKVKSLEPRPSFALQMLLAEQNYDESNTIFDLIQASLIWEKGSFEQLSSYLKIKWQVMAPSHRTKEYDLLFKETRNQMQGDTLVHTLRSNPSAEVFAMVGSAHLPTIQMGTLPPTDGIIAILEKHGYRLSRI